MKLLRKSIALLCSISMILCLVPSTVFASAEEVTGATALEEPIDTSLADTTLDINDLTVEDIVGENEALRDATTKHYQLTDGTMIAVSYPLAVHEQVDGKWIDIDNALSDVTDTDGDAVKQTAANNIRFSFVKGKGNGRLMKVESTSPKAEVIFELQDADKKELVMTQTTSSDELFMLDNVMQKGTYTNIVDGVDIEYIVAGDMLKENIIVKKVAAMKPFTFLLRCKNLTATLQTDHSVLLADADGNTVFTIPAPFMVDATGATSDQVFVTLNACDKGYYYTMTPSSIWTSDPERVYPITIDPVVQSNWDPTEIHGAYIKESNPDVPVGDDQYMWVGELGSSSGNTCYGLLKFDLPTIRACDYVIGSVMNLCPSDLSDYITYDSGWNSWNSNYLDGSMILEAHAITSSWNEQTVTWNNRPSFDASIMDAVALVSKHSIRDEDPVRTVINVTEIAKEWYNGGNNYGVLFKLNNEGTHPFAAEYCTDLWAMSEANDIMQAQPVIQVQYRSKAGLENVYSYASVSAGEAGTGYVQLNSGNLTFVHPDLGIDGSSMPVSIHHVYNTCNNQDDGLYGYGWTLNYAQTLKAETVGGTSYYVYTDADATKHYFDISETKAVYEDQSGLELKLTVGNTQLEIRDKNDTVWIFTKSSGRLHTIQNAYGKTNTITYTSSGGIARITDGFGRAYTFTYANGKLYSITAPDDTTLSLGYTSLNLTTFHFWKNRTCYRTDYITYGTSHELMSAYSDFGDKAVMTYARYGNAARVKTLKTLSKSGSLKSSASIAYDVHQSAVTDEQGRTVIYQFNTYGNTVCMYNDVGQAQYFRYYAPNEQNPNGDSTYGPNKLEVSSQTQYATHNVLMNHSFESDSAWTGDGSIMTHNTRYEGSRVLAFPNPADTDSKITSQTVTLTKGTTYTVSAYVATGDNTVLTMFADYGAGTDDYGSVTTSGTSSWKRIQFTFTVPINASTASVRIGFKVTGRGTAFVDCVQVERNTTANRYNLLQNGDFIGSAGLSNPTGWTLSLAGSGIAGIESYGDTSAFDLSANRYTIYPYTFVDASSPDVKVNASLSQTVTIKNGAVGTTISYGSWMKGDSLPDNVFGEDDDIRFGITVKLYNGDTEVQTQSTPANRFCEEWQFVGDVIVAKQAFTKVQIFLEYQNNCNRCYFDGAYVYRDYFGQSYTYDDDGNVISTSAYADQKSTFEYDGNDLITSVNPSGAEFEYTYNDMHDAETGTSAEGVTYAYRYNENTDSITAGLVRDAQTQLGSARDTALVRSYFDGNTWNPTYDTVTDVRGKTSTTYYNTDGSVKKVVDATGITTAYTYDIHGLTTAVTATDASGVTLSTVTYTYDDNKRLSSIHNGDVNYYFTYDSYDRVTKVSVGTSSSNAVTLSENTYHTQNGAATSLVDTATYGNDDSKTYTYDSRGRVTGVRFEGESSNHYTYTYDKEGCLTKLKNNVTGNIITYHYDLNKRLSEIRMGNDYTLTYEYDVGNALVGVKETINGVANSTRYVYNKDNVLTQMQSPTGTTVNYDYSYDRCVNYWKPSKLNHDFYTLGFPTTKTNITVASYDANLTPVPTAQTVKITRSGSTADISNDDAFRSVVLSDIQRRVLSFWYRSEDGASGTLTGKLRCTNGTAQDTVPVSINTDGDWHYAEMLFTPKAPLYTNVGDYVTPSITWETESGTGALIISGLSFGRETETVVNASQLGETLSAYNATYKTVTDAAAPMPSTTVREFTREANVGGWVYLNSAETATSTPQAGEIWEVSFAAKIVSGGVGNGFYFRFRECDESGNLTTTDASTAANIPLIDDNEWHTYTGYVTINSDAYENYGEIIPRFGWAQSNAAGTVRVNGVIIRKVGNQWNNSLPYFGFAQDNNAQTVLEEVDSTDSPIAYQKTIRAAHTGTQYTYTLNAPLASFPQPTATDKWTLSFWAKTDGDSTVALYKRTQNSGTPQATALTADGEWHYYTFPLNLGSGFDLTDITLYYAIYPQTELYLNGINLVPGTVALANESGQNSAALKNITIDTGTTKFNTAIEYDTDANRTAYSRVKHYINNGEAYSYAYDEAGNIKKITNPDGSWVDYEYDSLNQLKKETYFAGDGVLDVPCTSVEYAYDARGNLLSKTYSDGTIISYTYTDTTWKDRLTSYNGTAISYDTIGNPLNWINGETLTWQRGRQLASYTNNGITTTYAYDDTGLRTSKTVNGVTTNYSVVDGSLRRMTDGTNTLQFVYGNGLSSVIFNGTEYWYVFNAQGDVIGIINANGEYVVEYSYDSWGKPLSKTGSLADTLGTLNPFRYRGYIYDEETGFYYVSSRYYDPVIGRWLNSDSVVAGVGHSVQGCNLFAYCLNNPVNMADTTGELPFFLVTAAIGAVAGAVIGGVVAAKNGGNVWAGIGIGAAAGALIGTGAGMAAGAALAGSITATTGAVLAGGSALVSTVATGGVGAGVAYITNNLQQATSAITSTASTVADPVKNALKQLDSSGLRPGQTEISRSKIMELVNNFDPVKAQSSINSIGGTRYLVDGHHTTVASTILGKGTCMNMGAFTNQLPSATNIYWTKHWYEFWKTAIKIME